MIFHETWQQVLNGTKTQTRRLMKNDEYVWIVPNIRIVEVCDSNNRLKWRVGNTYAVQPGRGKKAIGRIEITKIGKECLNAITHNDAQAEGVGRSIAAFADLWDSIHSKGKRWIDNPDVWVLEFELAND